MAHNENETSGEHTPFEVRAHVRGDVHVAEVTAEGVIVRSPGDALDALSTAQYEAAARRVVLHAANLDPRFFDLASGLAGEILQKVSNYGLAVAIVGDFQDLTSRALGDFIRESNSYGQVVFVPDLDTAIERLASRSES